MAKVEKKGKGLRDKMSKLMSDLSESNAKNGPDCPGCRASTERLMERYRAEKASK